MSAFTEDLIKDILRSEGFPVPRGVVVSNKSELTNKMEDDIKWFFLKALIPTGRRGLSGAVFKTRREDIEEGLDKLINKDVQGYKVERVLVEESMDLEKELFLSFSFDRNHRVVVIMVTAEGGVEIETVIEEEPKKLHCKHIDSNYGLSFHVAVALWSRAGLNGKTLLKAANLTTRLYELFNKLDLTLLEINPLCIDKQGEVVIIGAMAEIDEDAAFRQKQVVVKIEEVLGENRWARLTELEKRVAVANYKEPGTGTVRYREIPGGDIALLTGGAGAGLVVVDSIRSYGGKPANYSDVGAGDVRERMKVLINTILSNKGIKGFLVAFSTLNLGRADFLAAMLKTALQENMIDPRQFPVVVRLAGLGEEKAGEILSEIEGLHFHGSDLTLEEAAGKMVGLVNGEGTS